MLSIIDHTDCRRCGGAGAVRDNGEWSWCFCQENTPPGSPAYQALLNQMARLHARKAADYGTGTNPLANLDNCERIGIPAWKGCLVRLLDKVQRIESFCQKGNLANESFDDSLFDLAAYALLAVVKLSESRNKHVPVLSAIDLSVSNSGGATSAKMATEAGSMGRAPGAAADSPVAAKNVASREAYQWPRVVSNPPSGDAVIHEPSFINIDDGP